jgi:hypothetical protein
MPASSSLADLEENIMNGDFTRVTFDQDKHYLSVLLPQGRPLLDADWNEQAAILLHYLQTLAADLIGPFGGPATGFSVAAILDSNQSIADLSINEGHYYVDGILCENNQWMDLDGALHNFTFFAQPDYRIDSKYRKFPTGDLLVYLDVWERLITSYEDRGLREVALGGPDTSMRAKVVWQVRITEKMPDGGELDIPAIQPADTTGQNGQAQKDWVTQKWGEFTNHWQPMERGLLKARAKIDTAQNQDACAVPPGARYRGLENQLYRVEIHHGGTITDKPTFKWSRDNGSVIFPIRKLDGTVAYLDHLGRDDRQSLRIYDWVEVVDDAVALSYDLTMADPSSSRGILAQVVDIDPLDLTVTLRAPKGVNLPSYAENSPIHPLLRRWDYSHRESRDASDANIPQEADDGALLVDQGDWLLLEDGIQIRFFEPQNTNGQAATQHYRSGDYWIIPARTATGDVEWPKELDPNGEVVLDANGNPKPRAIRPHGILHHYAPLAVVVGNKTVDVRSPLP